MFSTPGQPSLFSAPSGGSTLFGASSPARPSAPGPTGTGSSLFAPVAQPGASSPFRTPGTPGAYSAVGSTPFVGMPSASGSSLFSNPSASLFGTSSSTSTSILGAAPSAGSSLFGPVTPTSFPSLGGPGSSTSNTLSRQTTLGPGIVGTGQGGPLATTFFTPASSSFGSAYGYAPTAATSSFGPTSLGTLPAYAAAAKPTPVTIQQRIEAIYDAYNTKGLHCRLRHMLYNAVPAGEVPQFAKPPFIHDRLWQQAMEANPNPQRFVPVPVSGFDELKLRQQEQDKSVKEQRKTLDEMQGFIDNLQRKHELDTIVKIDQYRRRHLELAHRVLQVMRKVEVLRSQGIPISPQEEAFRTRLENLQRELNQPNHYKARLYELAALVRVQDERPPQSPETLDEESLEKMYTFLEEQTKALMLISDVLKGDVRDSALAMRVLTERTT